MRGSQREANQRVLCRDGRRSPPADLPGTPPVSGQHWVTSYHTPPPQNPLHPLTLPCYPGHGWRTTLFADGRPSWKKSWDVSLIKIIAWPLTHILWQFVKPRKVFQVKDLYNIGIGRIVNSLGSHLFVVFCPSSIHPAHNGDDVAKYCCVHQCWVDGGFNTNGKVRVHLRQTWQEQRKAFPVLCCLQRCQSQQS